MGKIFAVDSEKPKDKVTEWVLYLPGQKTTSVELLLREVVDESKSGKDRYGKVMASIWYTTDRLNDRNFDTHFPRIFKAMVEGDLDETRYLVASMTDLILGEFARKIRKIHGVEPVPDRNLLTKFTEVCREKLISDVTDIIKAVKLI